LSVDKARVAIDHAIDEVNRERSYIGSEQNNLQFTMSKPEQQYSNIDLGGCPVALEISLPLRTALIQQASDLDAMRPIGVSNSYQYPTALPRNCNRDRMPSLVPLRVELVLKM